MSFDYQYRLKKIESARERTNALKILISDFENALNEWKKDTQDSKLHNNVLDCKGKVYDYCLKWNLMNLE